VRDLLVASSLVITLAGTAQAFAQSSNPEESAARATMQSQTPGGTWAVIEAQVKNTLEQAGFKNIQVMPSSFVVQAEKNGQPLTLVINSNGKTVSYLPVPPTNIPDEERKDIDKTLGKD
jgi:protoheme ferro-lyase